MVCDVIFAATIDRIHGSLPPTIPESESNANFMSGVFSLWATLLPVLYAQVTGDGMGIGDHHEFEKFEKMFHDFLKQQLSSPKQELEFPDTHHLSISFVDNHFKEYLRSEL